MIVQETADLLFCEINNVDDITKFLLFALTGDSYGSEDLQEVVELLLTNKFSNYILHFFYFIDMYREKMQKKIKEALRITKRIYNISTKFPTNFPNGYTRSTFIQLIEGITRLHSKIQHYMLTGKLSIPLLRVALRKILSNSIKLNYFKNGNIR